MASLFTLLIIALSVSLDGFGVGLLYAARGIRIPAGSLLIIAGCSGCLLLAAMLLGDWLALRLTPRGAVTAGAAILVAVGLWSVVQFFRSQRAERPAESPAAVRAQGEPGPRRPAERMLVRLELRKPGIVVHILRTPTAADLDRSGSITAMEAALLGTALSLDAIGAGIGAALVGYGAALTALCIAAASGLFVHAGTVLGRRVAGRLGRRLAALPGFLLIGAGLLKLLQL